MAGLQEWAVRFPLGSISSLISPLQTTIAFTDSTPWLAVLFKVEEAWRIVDPVLDDATPAYPYQPGTWGPAEAQRVAPEGGWFDPLPG